MKKFIFLFSIIYILFNANSVFAQEYIKNFYAYEIKNVNIREFGVIAKNAIDAYNGPDKGIALKKVENAYIYTGKDYTYFIRVYPANQNTNIFIVSNEKIDFENNEITQFLEKEGYKYQKLKDKNAIKEYKYDFYILARQEKLGNFYISPDMAKPLKVGIVTMNNKISKYTQKTPELPYSIDSNPINLTCIDTTGYYDDNAKIAIIKKEYRLKEKPGKYIHAFEYIVTNKNTSTVSVTTTSEHHVNLVDVTTETMANLDRMDFIDMTCSFPTTLICTVGLSVIGSIPNWIRWTKLTKEASRYTHSLPKNYQLRSHGIMRVLILKTKRNPKPLNFAIELQGQTYNVIF